MPGMDMSGSGNGASQADRAMNAAVMFLMRESSGTSFQPAAWPMPMLSQRLNDWSLMWMGQAFLVDTQQAGPRGGDKLWSTNWGMLSAVHKFGSRGSLMLRTMLSLEPATIADRRYPLLFQSGETAFGRPIVDGQHPHNLFMEIGVQYARSLGETTTWNLYYAPVGEPALGPTPYPHRASAAELPQAALGHHWEDSTHIAYNVVTSGITWRKLRLEGSGFYGREPNENRWSIGFGPMNSWATRLSFLPDSHWQMQVSTGHLTSPEALEPGDVQRTTASIEYIRPRAHHNSWTTSLIWGEDYRLIAHHAINAVTAETLVPLGRSNFLTGRYEWSQRDELLADSPIYAGVPFDVNAFTGGFTHDFLLFRDAETGLGANASTYAIARTLQAFYGAHPWGLDVYFRVRLRKMD